MHPRACLALLCGLLTACGGVASAQSVPRDNAASHAIRGRVVDTDRIPVVGAEVAALRGGDVVVMARTGVDGRFNLGEFAPGRTTISVRRLGFRPREFDLDVPASSAPERITAVLTSMPTELEEIRVEARIAESNGRLREFYAHRSRSQFGYFMDTDVIAERHARHASDLLRMVPGARLIPSRGIGSAVRIRGCRPLLWIDGQRVPGAELDDAVNANDIAALEVYNSFAGIPPQYVDRASNCGAIVVWTKS